MSEFSARTVLITGAAGGIGKALAAQLCAEGANVVFADINIEAGEAAVTELLAANPGAEARFVRLDVTNPASCAAAVDETVRAFGRIDGFAHCAGVLTNAPFVDLPQKDVDFVIDVNLKGTLYILQAVGRRMLVQKRGKICVVASKAGKIGTPTLAHYAASKFGVIGLVQTAAMEWGRCGVYVNCVCLGEVDTEMLRKSYRKICEVEGITMEEQLRRGNEMSLVGRLSPPENVAKSIRFLLSEASDEITGQAVNTDGGIVFH